MPGKPFKFKEGSLLLMALCFSNLYPSKPADFDLDPVAKKKRNKRFSP